MLVSSPRASRQGLQVKRSFSGLGLFTERAIARGAFITEYSGPLLTEDEADRKGGKYLFAVLDTPWTIDGSGRDNLARYINHSCKPNCETFADGNRILIHAKRRIEAGEELHYDYGKEYVEELFGPGGCRCGHH